MKKLLVATYDISDLSEEEAASLSGEVHAMAEASDDHPSVTVEVAEHALGDPPQEVLVHLNIEVPAYLGLDADSIAEAVMAAYGVGAEGADDPLYEEMKVVVALAEEV